MDTVSRKCVIISLTQALVSVVFDLDIHFSNVWYSRKDGGKGEHLSRQVGQVSHHKDEAGLDYLDVFSASGQKAHQQAEHKTQEGTAKGNHKE